MHRSGSLATSLALALVCSALGSACTLQEGPMLDPRDAGTDAFVPDTGPVDAGFACTPDEPGCFGYTHYLCGPDGRSRLDEELCEGGCDPELGCIACVPGTFRCDGDVSLRCDEDHRWLPLRDCEEWGTTCRPSGTCDDSCGDAEAVRSNVGCEYWPVALANLPELNQRAYDFRVVVTNPSRDVANLTIRRGTRVIETTRVRPGGVAEIVLPWVDGVSFPFDADDWESIVTADGAYHLTSSAPVIVAQFNPFHYASAVADNSFTNDASLLLPAHVLGRDHVGISYVPFSRVVGSPDDLANGSSGRIPGYLAVVGTSVEPTEVEVDVTGYVAADRGGRWDATPPGGTIRFTLARGEVAQIAAEVPPLCAPDRPGFVDTDPSPSIVQGFCREHEYDLTGSRVRSDRPVAVFGGHTCMNVPYDVAACDHLETQLAPVTTWGRRFQTLPMREPGLEIPNLLRITAAHDGTVVTLDPAPPGGATVTLDAGEYHELRFDGPLDIRADKPIQAAQLLVGQNITTPFLQRGDPGLTMLVPEEQFRADYVFVLPSSYVPLANGQSYLLISREPGETITLDGDPLEVAWTRVGNRELAIVPAGGGTHRIRAASAVGLIAFGLGSYTSYAYPAGLDLRILPI